MSVRVNLLPEATKARSRAGHQRTLLIGSMAALVLVVALVHVSQLRILDRTEGELADAELELAVLASERSDLDGFADLEQRLTSAEGRISSALADEVSIAGLLQDVAAVTPEDTGLTSMTFVATPSTPEVPSLTVGSINIAGQTTSGHAPGVERLLWHFGKISTFQEGFFNSSTVDEDGVATFNIDIGALPSAKTNRYADGLPEEFAR